MDNKGQTGIELLLLIGGAVLVALMAGITLKTIANQSGNQFTNSLQKTQNEISN